MNAMDKMRARARAAKAAGMEPNGYVKPCDFVFCGVCMKHRSEKAPWNKTDAAREKSANK